jgi:hypothetical protein
MHSVEHNYSPNSFNGVWTKNLVNQGDRPLRNADNFMLPNPRTELFKKSPLYSLPVKWSNLDESRYIREKNSFKTVIKFSLLNAHIDSLQTNQPNQ